MYKLDRRNPKLREELPEDLTGIKEIYCDPRFDGTITGMNAVDGYYRISEKTSIRQIRVYDVKTAEEAHERAKLDGLVQGIMVETFLSEPQPCLLRRKN